MEDLKKAHKQARYWKNRCLLAEKCIEVSPCDPDITKKQIKAHKEWTKFKIHGDAAP